MTVFKKPYRKLISNVLTVGFFLFSISLTGCGEKQAEQKVSGEEKTVSGQKAVDESKELESTGAPRDQFHGFAAGNSSPGDPDFHKGTFLSETVGLQKENDNNTIKETLPDPNSPDGIIKAYSDILLTTPDDASAWVMVGNGYMMKKMYDDAIAKYNRALAIEALPDAYSNMGFAYQDKGEYDTAISKHEKALDIDPKFANSYYGIALAYEKKGELKKALRHWKGFLKVADEDRWIRIAKAKIEQLEKK